MDTDNIESGSECTEEQEKCARRRVRYQRPKRRKDKLIRLDDLIPKQDVTDGDQLLFGVNDTTQPSKDAKGGAGSAGGGGGTKGPTPTGGGVQGGTGAK